MNTPSDQDAAPEDTSKRTQPNKQESLEAELKETRDRHLRLAAEFDNYRKRTAQESERRTGVQKEGFIQELLPVIDNLERALASGDSGACDQVRQGVGMTLQQLRQLLHRHGIEPEETVGKPFDPHRHEAIATGHDPSKPDHSVLQTSLAGYRRGEHVFRPAKVVVNDLSKHEVTHGR
ncbi:nucleotide exchange factor GrpE [Verrucomicrobiota bacterium sgz303538]